MPSAGERRPVAALPAPPRPPPALVHAADRAAPPADCAAKFTNGALVTPQNCNFKGCGAFTGEMAVEQMKDLGISQVRVVGCSSTPHPPVSHNDPLVACLAASFSRPRSAHARASGGGPNLAAPNRTPFLCPVRYWDLSRSAAIMR